MSPPRMQSQDDRDLLGIEAKMRREAEGIPHAIAREDTSVLDASERRARRKSQHPLDRLERLEDRLDESEAAHEVTKKDLESTRAELDAAHARLQRAEDGRDKLLAQLVELTQQLLAANLELGTAKHKEALTKPRLSRDAAIKLFVALVALVSAVYGGSKL